MPKKFKGIGIYVAVLMLLLLTISVFFSMRPATPGRSYSEIMQYFDNYQVEKYELDLGTGALVMKVTGEDREITYSVPNVNIFLSDTENYAEEYNSRHPDAPLEYNYLPVESMPWWVSMLPSLLLIVLMVVFWVVMMRQAGGGGGKVMNFAKAKPKLPDEGSRTTFADVAGCDEEKEELVEIVEFLKNPKKFNTLGARMPKGVLLMGPPGTGKTLLAKAVAGEARVPFFSISGSDFVEMFVGVGASRVRDLFDQAKKNAPSIVFIDEIDAVGRHRGAGLGGGHDEREQTLNQLLVEMDGFEGNSGVIVMAATNRVDILDPALLRPGRFDRQVYVGLPDIQGRKEVLQVHSRAKPLAEDVNLETLAKSTSGFTGADLENLMNEGALLAARKNQRFITMADLQESIIKVIAGPEKKSHVVTPHARKLTAYHEAGHTIAMHALPTHDPVHQITIVPRGQAGGMTISLPQEDRSFRSRNELFEDIVALLGGRVAEEQFLGDISTGASSDLERATAIAHAMVAKYGMSDALGAVVYDDGKGEVFIGRSMAQTKPYSETIAASIDQEVKALIDKAYAQCRTILSDYAPQLETTAQYLLEHETMSSEAFEAVFTAMERAPEA